MDDTNTTTYEIIMQAKTWSDAAKIAVLRGGKLAEINDANESELINSAVLAANAGGLNVANTIAADGGGGAYLWIGGNDLATEGNWTWDGKNEGNGTQFWNGDFQGNPVWMVLFIMGEELGIGTR